MIHRSIALALTACAAALILAPAASAQGTPDLIVDQKTLQNHWYIRDETFALDQCVSEEGHITAGEHRVLRFSVSTPNIGTGDLFLGDPNVHYSAGDGLYEYATCHHHFHFRHYATYELLDPRTGQIWKAAKKGFCMIDIAPVPAGMSGQPPGRWQYRSCGHVGIPGNQGISAGWADEYVWQLAGQFFVLDGGDGQPPVPPGDYIIRITVNPGFVPNPANPGDKCRYADPNHPGVCHQLPELNYDNNVSEAWVTVPDHLGRTAGWGPGGNDPAPNQNQLTDADGEPLD